jgi:hypothetical protein
MQLSFGVSEGFAGIKKIYSGKLIFEWLLFIIIRGGLINSWSLKSDDGK